MNAHLPFPWCFHCNTPKALASVNGNFNAEPQSLMIAFNRAVVALFPAKLAFHTTVVGTASDRKNMQVHNSGTVPLEIKDITASRHFARDK